MADAMEAPTLLCALPMGTQWVTVGLNGWQWGLRVHMFTVTLQERHHLYRLTLEDAMEDLTMSCAV